MPLKKFRKTTKKNRKENDMNKIAIMALLYCLFISSSFCEAETVHMDMKIDGQATKQPNGQYEVPMNGIATFTVKLPKMPKRNEEIWLFKWAKLSWFFDGAPDQKLDNSISIQVSLDPKKAPRQINIQSLLTHDYLKRGTMLHDQDYGMSDLVVLNFLK